MSKTLLPILTFPPDTKFNTHTSGGGKEYLEFPSNTVEIGGKLYSVYTSDKYTKVFNPDTGREASLKTTVLRFKEITAAIPKPVAAPKPTAPSSFKTSQVAKVDAAADARLTKLEEGLAAIMAALTAPKKA